LAGPRVVALDERADITGNVGDPEQPRLSVKQVTESRRVHFEYVHQIEQYAGGDAAAACAPDQPVERRETHSGVDAAAVAHCAHARTIAEMRDDRPLRAGGDLPQPPGDVFVGKTVESVAADTRLLEPAGQGDAAGEGRDAAVEGGVE